MLSAVEVLERLKLLRQDAFMLQRDLMCSIASVAASLPSTDWERAGGIDRVFMVHRLAAIIHLGIGLNLSFSV